MSALKGSCHCGRVTVEIAGAPAEVSECNCTLCRRIGGLWHYCPPEDAAVAGACDGYVQGDCSLTTWRCSHCGCVTHWTAIDPAYCRMGVNMRIFDPAVWRELPRQFVDGARY